MRLPHSLAEAEKIVPDWVFYVLVAAFAITLFYFIGRWLNRYLVPLFLEKIVRPKATQSAPAPNISEEIEAIRAQFKKRRLFREGCHALSSEMRTHLSKKHSFDIEHLSVERMKQLIKSKTHLEFFSQLRNLQFGTNEVSEKKYDHIFNLARSASRKKLKTVK